MDGDKAIITLVVIFVAMVAALAVYYGGIDKMVRPQLYGTVS